jgi:hypothetical protein
LFSILVFALRGVFQERKTPSKLKRAFEFITGVFYNGFGHNVSHSICTADTIMGRRKEKLLQGLANAECVIYSSALKSELYNCKFWECAVSCFLFSWLMRSVSDRTVQQIIYHLVS